MYLQNDFDVTTTTNLDVLKMLTEGKDFDLLILDTELSKEIVLFCKEFRENNSDVPLLLTYVYENHNKTFDPDIRQYATTVFYKPFDLSEVTKQLAVLTV